MPRINIAPLPPGWRREEEPTYPEPIKGSGTPIKPLEADPFTGQDVATPLSASYKDQIEQMVGKLANRTGKFVTGGGEPKMASSVMGETGDRLANVVASYLKMFAPDPTDIPMPGVVVPRSKVSRVHGRQMPGAFRKRELEAQKELELTHEKLLRAWQNDRRPKGEYTLSMAEDLKGVSSGKPARGTTEVDARAGRHVADTPIRIRFDKAAADPDVPFHEAKHSFDYRRQAERGEPMTGLLQRADDEAFHALPPDYQKRYINANGGDVRHAIIAHRADLAAHRLQLAPTRFTSIAQSARMHPGGRNNPPGATRRTP